MKEENVWGETNQALLRTLSKKDLIEGLVCIVQGGVRKAFGRGAKK